VGYYVNDTVSIAQAVRDVLESNWLFFQMLQSGIVNLTGLATKIKPDIEKRVGAPISTNAVVAALNRLYKSFERDDNLSQLDKLPSGIKLSLADNVLDLLIDRDNLNDFSVMFDKLRKSAYVPFSVFQTSKEYRFYIENVYQRSNIDLEGKFPTDLKSEKGITKITVNFGVDQEQRILNTLIYEISDILYNNQLHFYSFPSSISLIRFQNSS
jgi:hypothetical protein